MCKTHNPRKIDKCMVILIDNLKEAFGDGVDILACCCGHGKYPMTIVAQIYQSDIPPYDLCSNVSIPRKRKFYKKDRQGYYYIPEVIAHAKSEAKIRKRNKGQRRRKSLLEW